MTKTFINQLHLKNLGLVFFAAILIAISPSPASAATKISSCSDLGFLQGIIYTQTNLPNGGISCSALGTTLTFNPDGTETDTAPLSNTVTNTDANGKITYSTSCAVGWTNLNAIFSPTCWGRTISAIIGSMLITLTAWLLEAVGLLFNYLVYYTVVTFGSFASTSGATSAATFMNDINTGWSLFRDLSNIVIIGLFTFISISIILGLKEYGAKKMVARVLIIAVLINFSLLFTKLIVDASNFTAYQFYNAAQMNGSPPSQTTGSIDQFTQTGIAGQFITYMGVTGITDAFSTLKTGADSVQNGWIVLLHGLLSATMLLGAALVLLYGCFLLVTRAIMIIVLMLTASIAFATHLVPAFDKRGWSLWWESLVNVAVFAPVLMIFLWITITLAQALKPAGGALGALVADPTNGGNLGALFGYIMILGLLYASFKISNTFASMASGLNFAGLAAGTLALATGGIAGLALRSTVGGTSANRLANLRASVDAKTAANKDYKPTMSERFRGQMYNSLSKATFDPTKTKLGGSLTKGAPGSSLFKDAGKGGFEGVKNRQAKAAVKSAEVLAPTKERLAKAIEAQQQSERDTIKAAIESETKNLKSANENKSTLVTDARATQADRAGHEEALRTHQAAQQNATDEKQRELADHASKMSEIKTRIEKAGNEVMRQQLRARRTDMQETHGAKIASLDANISASLDQIKSTNAALEKLDKDAEATVNANIAGIQAKVDTAQNRYKELEDEVKGADKLAKEAKVNTAKTIAHRRPGTLFGLMGTPADDAAANRINTAFLDKAHKEHEMHEWAEAMKHAGGGAPKPKPPKPGATPGDDHGAAH